MDKKDEFIKEAEKFLTYFRKDVSKEEIVVHDGDHSVVMRGNGKDFSKEFLGHSIREVAEAYAKLTNKKLKWIE